MFILSASRASPHNEVWRTGCSIWLANHIIRRQLQRSLQLHPLSLLVAMGTDTTVHSVLLLDTRCHGSWLTVFSHMTPLVHISTSWLNDRRKKIMRCILVFPRAHSTENNSFPFFWSLLVKLQNNYRNQSQLLHTTAVIQPFSLRWLEMTFCMTLTGK